MLSKSKLKLTCLSPTSLLDQPDSVAPTFPRTAICGLALGSFCFFVITVKCHVRYENFAALGSHLVDRPMTWGCRLGASEVPLLGDVVGVGAGIQGAGWGPLGDRDRAIAQGPIGFTVKRLVVGVEEAGTLF